MTEKLNKEHFVKFMQDSVAGEQDLERQYEAWGVDPDALHNFVNDLTKMSLLSLFYNRNPHLEFYSAITIGIELGFRMALELESERIANDS